jgi:hypothetical protein
MVIYSKNTKNRLAMTFVEILIAGFFMIVVFTIGWLIASSFTGVKKVRIYENAIFLANEAIEAVRAARNRELGLDKDKGHNTLMSDFNSAGNQYDKDPGGFLPEVEIGGIKYTRKVSIEEVPSTNKDMPSCLKMIHVNVSWRASEDNAPVEFEVITAHCDLW